MRSAKPSTTAVLPTPASPVRIGLFWRRRVRMSMIWRISKSRPRTGSISPAFAPGRQVDRELVERLRPARDARGAARRVAGRRLAERRRVAVLGRARDDLRRTPSGAPRRRSPRTPWRSRARGGRGRRSSRSARRMCAGADPRGAELDRADEPRLLDQLREAGRERRRAGVAGLEPVERPHEVLREPRLVDLEAAQDPVEVGVRRLAELEEQVLDVDVVVRPRQAEPGRPLEGVAAGVVQSADEGLQVHAHGRFLPLLALWTGPYPSSSTRGSGSRRRRATGRS